MCSRDHASGVMKGESFVTINIRDLALLQFCLEQKFMTLNQIARMFFPENQEVFNWPMKCVRKLVNEGLLYAEKPGFCEHALYRVTRKGAALLKKHDLTNGLGAIEKIDTRSWEHDLWVTDVRIIFYRRLGLKHWKAERLLKQENVKKKVPDGIMSFQDKDLIIEVERTLKKKEYYEKTLLDMGVPNEHIKLDYFPGYE
ncbi:MAG: replication-relaxation family protein [Candidatus Omnitrophica bacterium]|nr:replication-relaxation family protein [Candidatus Omnitrophota bacterium]